MILLKNRSFEPFLIDGPLKLRSKRADLRLVDLYYLTFLFTSPSTKTCSSSKKHNPSSRKVHFHRFVAIISSNGNIEHRYLRLTCTVQKFFNFLSWSQPIIMSIADFFRGWHQNDLQQPYFLFPIPSHSYSCETRKKRFWKKWHLNWFSFETILTWKLRHKFWCFSQLVLGRETREFCANYVTMVCEIVADRP